MITAKDQSVHRTDGHGPSLAVGQAATAKEARQWSITDRLMHQGDCSPQELASAFNVSLMTIHRDLDELERRGVVSKFHGGVTVQPSAVFESQLSFRLRSSPEEKRAIADAALQYVEPGMSVMIDDSTSALAMVDGFKGLGPLHLVTNFVSAITKLAAFANEAQVTIIGVGGQYDLPHDAFVGGQCVEQISNIRTDALFMSSSAVTGCDCYHQEERIVAIKRAMIEVATKRYLLVDHSKVGRIALNRVAHLSDFDLVITDDGIDPEVLRVWDSSGVRYQVASRAHTD